MPAAACARCSAPQLPTSAPRLLSPLAFSPCVETKPMRFGHKTAMMLALPRGNTPRHLPMIIPEFRRSFLAFEQPLVDAMWVCESCLSNSLDWFWCCTWGVVLRGLGSRTPSAALFGQAGSRCSGCTAPEVRPCGVDAYSILGQARCQKASCASTLSPSRHCGSALVLPMSLTNCELAD